MTQPKKAPPAKKAPAKKAPTKTPPAAADKGNAVEDIAAQLKNGLDKWAQLAQTSLNKASSGSYKADELVADMAQMSVLVVGQAANVVQLGIVMAERLRTSGGPKTP